MKTYIIVKASTKRYHIYNGAGECVAIVSSYWEVLTYIDEVFCLSSCTSYTFKPTSAAGTFIVTMKYKADAQQRPTGQFFFLFLPLPSSGLRDNYLST